MKINLLPAPITINRHNINESSDRTTNNVRSFDDFSYQKYIGVINKAEIIFKANNDFKAELEKHFDKDTNEEFFEFLLIKFEKKAQEKYIQKQIADDVVQNAIVKVITLLEEYNSSEITKEKFLEELNNLYIRLRPTRNEYVSRNELHLDAPVESDSTSTSLYAFFADDENHKIRYSKLPSIEEHNKQKRKVRSAVSKAVLTKGEQEKLSERFSENDLVSYEKIAKKYGISIDRAIKVVHTAILKIQTANNVIPDETAKIITNFASTFNISYKQAQDVITRHCGILSEPIIVMNDNVDKVVEKFKNQGLTKKDYIASCVLQPQLFCQNPETITKNVLDVVQAYQDYGLNLNKYLSVCLKQPSLFCRSPKTVIDNIKNLTEEFEKFGLTKEQYIQCCLKYPSLFERTPESIAQNINSTVKNFKEQGLTKEKFISCCMRQPCLFYYSPDRIKNNVSDFVKEFDAEGLTIENYINSCISQPSLFCRNPKTLAENIKELVKYFDKNGLTLKKYISACLRHAPLFYLNKDTMQEHFDILRLSEYNSNNPIDNEEFWNKILNKPVRLTYSSSLLLIENLIIPKMFEGSKIPKELKGTKLKDKLQTYLRSHQNEKYILNIKTIDCKTEVLTLLHEVLRQISIDALNRDDIFEINIIQD